MINVDLGGSNVYTQDMETWKPVNVADYGSNYEVSDHGQVRRSSSGPRTRVGFVLKQQIGRSGYLTVGLNYRSQLKTFSVHRLVALTFIPCEHPNFFVVNHKDLNKHNNHVSNLEWITSAENIKHWARTTDQGKGEKHPMVKLTADQVRAIIPRLADGESYHVIAAEYNLDPTAIMNIASGKSWSSLELTPELQALRDKAKAQVGSHKKRRGSRPGPQGENHHLTHLTRADVIQIIQLRLDGSSMMDLQNRFNLDANNIRKIHTGKTWKLPGDVEVAELRQRLKERGRFRHDGKLTDQTVEAIIRDRFSGMSYAAVAKRHDIAAGTVTKIIQGSRWNHVKLSPEAMSMLTQLRETYKGQTAA